MPFGWFMWASRSAARRRRDVSQCETAGHAIFVASANDVYE